MKGSVFQRAHQKGKRNEWTIWAPTGYDATTGKYGQRWEVFHGTQTNAKKRLDEIIYHINTGQYIKPGKTTVAEYLEAWLKDYCWPNLTPRSAESYAYVVTNHITPKLGRILLTDLKPEHLQRLYTEKMTSLSPRTVQYIHATLHKSLGSAVKMGRLIRNPADAVDCPKQKRREMQVWDESEVNRFLEHAKHTEHHALFYLALFTGMRRSELLALKWSDVDVLLCQLSVRRTIHQLHDGQIIFGEPKTEKSRRLISLTPSTALVLRDHYEKQDAQRQKLGFPALTDDDMVFSHFDGKPMLPDSITHIWTKLAKAAGVKAVTLHGARHSHASLMLKQGTHVKVVSERLGHANITTTLNVYSHVLPGLQEAAASRFDDMLIPKRENAVPANHS